MLRVEVGIVDAVKQYVRTVGTLGHDPGCNVETLRCAASTGAEDDRKD